jgi:hypothetical protein
MMNWIIVPLFLWDTAEAAAAAFAPRRSVRAESRKNSLRADLSLARYLLRQQRPENECSQAVAGDLLGLDWGPRASATTGAMTEKPPPS